MTENRVRFDGMNANRSEWFVWSMVVVLIACLGLISACRRDEKTETASGSETTSGQGQSGASKKDDSWLGGLMPGSSREVTLPAGTLMTVKLSETVGSAANNPGDTIQARTTSDITVGGEVVVPAGSEVTGKVIEAVPLKKIGGRPKLTLQFISVRPPEGDPALIQASYTVVGKSETKKDAGTIAGSAVGGAIIGRIIGHDKGEEARGTAIGGVAGAAAGTAIAAATKGHEIVLPAGSVLQVRLQNSADISI